jgi:hypothetical protein
MNRKILCIGGAESQLKRWLVKMIGQPFGQSGARRSISPTPYPFNLVTEPHRSKRRWLMYRLANGCHVKVPAATLNEVRRSCYMA